GAMRRRAHDAHPARKPMDDDVEKAPAEQPEEEGVGVDERARQILEAHYVPRRGCVAATFTASVGARSLGVVAIPIRYQPGREPPSWLLARLLDGARSGDFGRLGEARTLGQVAGFWQCVHDGTGEKQSS